MAITFAGGIITVANGTFTWQDVKDADDSNAWGQIAELGEFMSQCIAQINIGDDTNATTLVVEDEIIDFQNVWNVQRFGILRFGQKVDGRPSHGVHLIFDATAENTCVATDSGQADETECQLLIYDNHTTIENTLQRENYGANITDPYFTDIDRLTYERIAFDSTESIVYVGANSFANDFVTIGNRYGMEFEAVGITLNNIKPHHVQESALRIFSSSVTVRNFRGSNNNFDVKATNGHAANVIDSLFDDTKLFHDGGAGANVTNNQKSINWTFSDPAGSPLAGARAILWDNVDTIVFNSVADGSGVLAEKIVTIANYTGTNTPPTPPTKVNFNPHFLRQYKYGQVPSSGSLTLTSKISGTIVLADDPVVVLSEAAAAALTGIAIDYGLETVIISVNRSLNDIYDYMAWHIFTNPQRTIETAMRSADGDNFTLDFDFTVNTGITVTATNQVLTLSGIKNWTLAGTAAFTGVIVDSGDSHVHIRPTIVNPAGQGIQNTRVRILGPGELLNGLTDGQGKIEATFTYTGDQAITGKARQGSTSPLYAAVDFSGTITGTGYSALITMADDE